MKKRILAVLATTALVGVASAYAANPFADVPQDSWAYQAVTTLAEQGVVVGYPDGYFKGERNITRYEMAQIIARAMAKEDRVNAEQQAMINKLADEFSTELNNLGVRVSNLEKRVGNVKLTGEAELKFGQYHIDHVKENGKEEAYTGEVKLGVEGKVSENTTAGARLKLEMGFGDEQDTKNVTFDRLWLKHDFGAASLTAGRQGLFIGSGLVYDDSIDGAVLASNYKNVGLVAGYGYAAADKNTTLVFAQAGFSPMENTGFKAYYARVNLLDKAQHADVYGVAADYNQDGIMLGGEWAKTGKGNNNTAWTAYIGYGNYDQAKAGTWSVTGRYVDFGNDFAGQHTTFTDFPYAIATVDDVTGPNVGNDYKGWAVNGSYALADNLGLSVDYYFGGKEKLVHQNAKKLGSAVVAKLNYQF